MSGRALLKGNQLRLCVVTTLAAGTVGNTAEALILPPKPLAFSSTWDCRSNSDNDWLCRSNVGKEYRNSLEPEVSARGLSFSEQTYNYSPDADEESAYIVPEMPQLAPVEQLPNPAVVDSAVLLELLNAPPESYALQWQASNSREPLERLQTEYPILRDATIAEYQRSGRQWFILLDGPYPSRIAAMAALKREPRATIASRFYPWTRSVASIQHLDIIRPEQFAGISGSYPNNSATLHDESLDVHYSNEFTDVSGQQQTTPDYQAATSYHRTTNNYNVNAYSPPLHDRSHVVQQNVQQGVAYGREEQAPVNSYEPRIRDYSLESAERQFWGGNRQVIANVGYRNGYSENYFADSQSSRQIPVRLAQPTIAIDDGYDRGYRSLPEKQYRGSQQSEVVYSQQSGQILREREPAYSQQSGLVQRERQPVYREPSHYNNDLKYAIASTGNQIILPPSTRKNERPNYSNNHQQNLRPAQVRQQENYNVQHPNYNGQQANHGGQQSKRSNYEHNPVVYRKKSRPQPRRVRKDYNPSAVRPEKFSPGYNQPYLGTGFNAPSGSYTIQWLAANSKTSLERVQLRYPLLQNAKIIHYRKSNSDWYVLIGGTFNSRQAAQDALALPPYSRLTARLYPWVRSVDALKQMIASTSHEAQHVTEVYKPATPLEKLIANVENGYTIQWYAANKPEAVKRMQKRFPELANAVTVHFKRNHKDWYVLLQGQFSSSRDAISTIKSPTMRKAARFLHPWTRPVNTLKKLDIRGQG